MFVFLWAAACSAQQSAQVLADILEQKGVIGASERARIRAAGNEDGVRELTAILRASNAARFETTPVASARPPISWPD